MLVSSNQIHALMNLVVSYCVETDTGLGFLMRNGSWQIRGMGDLQFSVLVSGLGGRTRGGSDELAREDAAAIVASYDMLLSGDSFGRVRVCYHTLVCYRSPFRSNDRLTHVDLLERVTD